MDSIQSLCAKRAFYFSSLGYYFSVGYFAWENLTESPKAAPSGDAR